MKISIVTPSFNRATFLNDTIESILGQKGDFSLEYIVQDGGSGDEVIDILDSWKRRVDEGLIDVGCNELSFDFFVEQDRNMYDAIRKGFEKSDGRIMAWLNSDDMYHPYALSSVADIFLKFNDVDWITGIPNSYNRRGQRAGFDKTPPAYAKDFVAQGFQDNLYLGHGFNWIQQESTFWRRSLWDQTDGLNLEYKYAADFHLWREFASLTDLVKVESFLGGFRVHDDQITADPQRYRSELHVEEPPPEGLRKLVQLLEVAPWTREKYLASDDEAQKRLTETFGLSRQQLCGRAVEWSHTRNEWVLVWKLII